MYENDESITLMLTSNHSNVLTDGASMQVEITNNDGIIIIRASVDALCRDGAVLISRERVQRGRLTRQGTTS